MSERKKTKKTEASEDEKQELKFPEISTVKPDKIAGMTHEEKLKLIEREAQTLYDFCLEKGLSKGEMSWCLKPLFGSPPEYVKKVVKDNSKFCLSVALILGIFAIFVGWSPAYNQLCIHGKLALVKVLPYWDWTYLYEKDCVVPNPYVAPLPNITKEECGACFDITKNGIEGLSNASLEVISNDFLLADFPVIIEDGIKGWPKPNITLPSLEKEYNSEPNLDNLGECRFNSSVEDLTTVYEFFTAFNSGELPETYFASWDNCDLKAAKHFRLQYKRPYFLPPMAEAAKSSSFLVSKGKFNEPVPFQIDEEASGIWLTVITGSLLVEFVPIDGCAGFKGCAVVSNTLKAGEAVLVPTRLWLLDITPISKGITIALGSTAQWDEPEGFDGPPDDGPPEKDIPQKPGKKNERQDKVDKDQENGDQDDAKFDQEQEMTDQDQENRGPTGSTDEDDAKFDKEFEKLK